MFPLQITLAPDKHSDSRKTFFSQWERWIQGLQQFDVVPEFVWISPKGAEIKEHCKSPEWAHVERNVPISQVSEKIWNWYDKAKQRQGIREAPEILQVVSEESEESEGTEEQRSDGPSAAAGTSV
jgi:hypothetical protein